MADFSGLLPTAVPAFPGAVGSGFAAGSGSLWCRRIASGVLPFCAEPRQGLSFLASQRAENRPHAHICRLGTAVLRSPAVLPLILGWWALWPQALVLRGPWDQNGCSRESAYQILLWRAELRTANGFPYTSSSPTSLAAGAGRAADSAALSKRNMSRGKQNIAGPGARVGASKPGRA